VAYRKLEPISFEQWITKNFGSVLFRIFFKTYTEKVWGIPCDQIGVEWASQRIKGLNFTEIVRSALPGHGKSTAKSLVETFYYPVKGAGQMYERMADRVTGAGASIDLESSVEIIRHNGSEITEVLYQKQGKEVTVPVEYLFSSMPLTHFIKVLRPAPPKEILQAASELYYRDHITVNLNVRGRDLFPDNWIYVHSPEVKMARLANYNNFSKSMAASDQHSIISVEYFVFKNDDIWNLSDTELIELASKEMGIVGLLNPDHIEQAYVVRETESYPTYYLGHKHYYDLLKNYVEQFKNLQLIGRGGMYR
jgi:protoporphyrinogen oxidase